MAERFLDFEIRRFKNWKKIQKTKILRKASTLTWFNVWTSWAENNNFKTNLLAYEAEQLNENKHKALDDWISQLVV